MSMFSQPPIEDDEIMVKEDPLTSLNNYIGVIVKSRSQICDMKFANSGELKSLDKLRK